MPDQIQDTHPSSSPTPSELGGVPALVVSGFLGAGKTSLVKHLITEAQQQSLRLAVVSNEFGDLGIDRALLQEAGGPGYVELEGGCVCCQLSNELLGTLQNLWETVRPDRVVVETSGVALPFETLMTFWREPLTDWVGESLAVVVVNAEQLGENRDLEGTFEQQVSSADLLVLNKLDLVQETSLPRLEGLLREMAPGAPLIKSIQGRIDTNIFFPSIPKSSGGDGSKGKRSQGPHTHEEFEAQECSFPEDIIPEELIRRIKALQALRVKGIVKTSEGLKLIQGVGPRVEVTDPPGYYPQELTGRLVVIRKKIA